MVVLVIKYFFKETGSVIEIKGINILEEEEQSTNQLIKGITRNTTPHVSTHI